jgi:3-hydroxyacyl-CoA dehydrogenase
MDLPDAVPRVRAGIEGYFADRMKRSKLTAAEARDVMDLITVDPDLSAAPLADWIIEAVAEDFGTKKSLLAGLESCLKADTL